MTRASLDNDSKMTQHVFPAVHREEKFLPVLRGCLLESIAFWVFLLLADRALRVFVRLGDPSLEIFARTFITDFLFRRFLTAGNPVDPLHGFVCGFDAESTSAILLGNLISGPVIVVLAAAALNQTAFPPWGVSSLLFSAVIEYLACLVNHARYSFFHSLEKNLAHRFRASRASVTGPGLPALHSFITASLVALGSRGNAGGPMLNLNYALMVGAMHGSWGHVFVAVVAQIAAAHTAIHGVKASLELTFESVSSDVKVAADDGASTKAKKCESKKQV